MKRFLEYKDRFQGVLLPEFLAYWAFEDKSSQLIDAFVNALDLLVLGVERVTPAAAARPGYHFGMMLKLYVYGYMNQVASSRRLEREAGRNADLMWLTGRLTPDFQTITDFRKDNGPAGTVRATVPDGAF